MCFLGVSEVRVPRQTLRQRAACRRFGQMLLETRLWGDKDGETAKGEAYLQAVAAEAPPGWGCSWQVVEFWQRPCPCVHMGTSDQWQGIIPIGYLTFDWNCFLLLGSISKSTNTVDEEDVVCVCIYIRKWQPTPVFLPWRIPWTEEPGRLLSMGLQESDIT